MRDLEEIQKEALKCNSISRNLQIVLCILLVIQFAILVYLGYLKYCQQQAHKDAQYTNSYSNDIQLDVKFPLFN
mgnify:FL=1